MGRSVMEGRLSDGVQLLLKMFKTKEKKGFNLENIVFTSISNAIYSLAFGCYLSPHDERYFDMLRRIREVFVDESMAGIASFMPVLAHLPGDLFRIKRIKTNYKMILRFINELVNDHLQTYDENNVDDFTSAFIREIKKQETSKETSFTGMYIYCFHHKEAKSL